MTTEPGPHGGPHGDIAVLVERAAAGDRDAAASVYDATIADAWRIAVAVLGCPDQAARTLAAGYQELWSGPRPRPRSHSGVLARLYVATRAAAATAA